MSEANSQTCSHAEEISAYLDGELSLASENGFEQHLTQCVQCLENLNLQKRLLCHLNFAFDNEKSFELPIDFARTVTVRAESNVSGLRSKTERRSAFMIAGGLLLIGIFVAVIGRQNSFILPVANNFGRQIFAVVKVATEFCYDCGLGLMVILRAAGRMLNVQSSLTVFILMVLLLVSLVALSGLLLKFHRPEQSNQ